MMNDQHTSTHDVGILTSFFPWLQQVTSTTQGLLITTIIVFLTSVLMEALGAAMRNLHFHQFLLNNPRLRVVLYNGATTLLHTSEMTLMLMLMVIFMTLNTWLCISIITGSAVGYLIFNWNSLKTRDSRNKAELSSGTK